MEKQESKKIKLPIVFMGTSELSAVILAAMIKEGYKIVGVFTKPDAKIGREQEIVKSPVKKLAQENKIPLFQPEKLNLEAVEQLKKLKPDLIIVAAFGKIIPQAVLDIPGFGCINVHASLLPKYRGPSPIQNAIMAGENQTGISIMLMDKGIDTGDILAQEKIDIDPDDNTATLMEKLSDLSAALILKTLPLWIERKIQPQPQNNSLATLCQLIEREDGHIFWSDRAEDIYNRYRALSPWPGIFSYWKDGADTIRLKLKTVKLQKMDPQQKHTEGEIFEIGNDIGVQTAEGVIILKEIQREGKKTMDVKEFVNGCPNFVGSILG
jgi:methionyl-tRNA formyltransferase